MNEKEYEEFVWSKWHNTAIEDLAASSETPVRHTVVFHSLNVMAFCMGLAGESGEVVDLLKKHTVQGQDFDEDELIEELGDIEYYLQLIRSQFGIKSE